MAAGAVKAALALHHKVLAPQVPVPHPSERLATITSSAYILTEPRPWIKGDNANPRRAAVMGANFDPVTSDGIDERGGRSSVMIMEEEPEERQ